MPSTDTASARTALIVLGMHRSGTSAMAGVLGRLGAALPERLMPPSDANPKGYFESLKAYGLNDAILASAGSSWADPLSFDPDWHRSTMSSEYRLRAAEVIKEEFGGSDLFVLKDPRICRLLPFWRQVFADLGVRPLHVCIHRHPREVASSLSRREGWTEVVGILLWLRHVLDAEAESRGQPRVFVSYETLLSDWRTTVDRIAAGLDLQWPRQSDAAAPDVEDFLSDELRHFRAADEKTTQDSPAFGWVVRTYRILERWAVCGEQAADHAELDALKAAFDQASPLLGQLSQESRDLQTRLMKAKVDLDSMRAGLQGEIEALARGKQTVEGNLAQMRSTLSERERRLDELRGQTKRQADKIAEMSGELESLHLSLKREYSAQVQTLGKAQQRTEAEFEAYKRAITASSSWRLTAPLRGISRLLKGR